LERQEEGEILTRHERADSLGTGLSYHLRVDERRVELPKYRQIFDSLKEAIMAGQYQAGQRLPSESEFVKVYSTSRLTVNRALRELQVQGLIDRRVGSGSYVSAAKSPGYSFGLLIPDLGGTEIFEPICRGMAEVQLPTSMCSCGAGAGRPDRLETQARACQQWSARRSGVFFAPLERPARRMRSTGGSSIC
jgi:DNA-binding transcriptional MocR family regulator